MSPKISISTGESYSSGGKSVRVSNIFFFNSLLDYKLEPYDEVLSRFEFFFDNNFFELRDAVLDVLGMCNTPLDLEIREKASRQKSCKERERYEKKCFNNSYKYDLL